MGNNKITRCQDCEYFQTFCSTFYDDDFVEFACSKAGRTIARITSSKVKDFSVPKWCPKNYPKTSEVTCDDD